MKRRPKLTPTAQRPDRIGPVYDERSAYLQQLATSPIGDSVRHDGRFMAVLRRAWLATAVTRA
jgi:hypothetical protein